MASSTRLSSSIRGTALAFRPKTSPGSVCLNATTTTPRSQPLQQPSSSRRPFSSTHPSTFPIDHTTSRRESEALATEEALLASSDFTAAPEITFDAQQSDTDRLHAKAASFLRGLRVTPASPSYFTARPSFTDDYLHLQSLLRRSITLPVVAPGTAPRVAWRALDTYRAMTDENVRSSKYKRMLEMLKRMNTIHPSLVPAPVAAAMNVWARDIQPFNNRPAPILIDPEGRAAAVGRRKASSAKAWVVEGDGEVLVNGKPLHMAFARAHDRASVIWALKATGRTDKYNVWANVHGGGTTGQAEALTLAISKALMAHEPGLKTSLRRAGCVARDPRRVERKKPGRPKARKGYTWVKR